jgi:NitT/TauT family transport system permease protein
VTALAASEPVAAKRGWSVGGQIREWLPAIGFFLGALLAWELLVRLLGIKQFILPSPVAIANAVVTYFPELWQSASYTLVEILLGLAIGVVAGILAGIVTARYGAFRESILPFAIAANSVPIIAFAPIFNNWFGIDKQLSKAMIAAVICFFPVMINTVRGLTSAPPAAIELMRSYAATDAQVMRKVRIPAALPYIFTALRVATTLATIGAIIGEYFGAPKVSLGQYIVTYSSYLNFERSWAAIIFACAIGIGLYIAVVLAERLVAPWTGDRVMRTG